MADHRYKGGERDSASLVRGMSNSYDTGRHKALGPFVQSITPLWQNIGCIDCLSPYICSIHLFLFLTSEVTRGTFEIAALPTQPVGSAKGMSSTMSWFKM